MFSYETPKWNIKFDAKKLSIFFTCIYVLSLIPMLVLGFYDFPSADDFSMAMQPHKYFLETGNLLGTLGVWLQKSYYVYSNYEGYFFSIMLTCICPGIFGEGFYVLTPFIILGMLTFGVCYFFDALFVRVWKLDKDLTNIVRMIVLTVMVQCIHGEGIRVEAFYWYAGAINYTSTFGMAFFWLGLLLRSIYDEDEKSRKRKLIWASIWGFFMGGANYLTALELAICSVIALFLLIMIRFMKKSSFKLEGVTEAQQKSFGFIWIPTLLNLIGFGFACFAPGIATRAEETNQTGPVKAVFLSLYSTFDVMMNQMMRWEILVAFVLLIPICWKLAEGLKQKLEHPIMFGLFAFLMVSSNVTPPIYAVSNFDAGRLRALAFFEFVFMMSLVMFYFTAWMRQHILGAGGSSSVAGADNHEDKGGSKLFSHASSMMIAICVVFIALGSGLCMIPERGYYCATSALNDIMSGDASKYRAENMERLAILKDDSVKEVVLEPHTVRPEMLFYQDITYDAGEWINYATADYYYKDKLYIFNENEEE